jgi:hypothetical protein
VDFIEFVVIFDQFFLKKYGAVPLKCVPEYPNHPFPAFPQIQNMDLGEGDLIKADFLPYFRLFENGGAAGGGKNGDYQTHFDGTEPKI